MRCEVGDAANGVALHLDVGAEHLPNQWLEPPKLDDEKLVLGCGSKGAQMGKATSCESTYAFNAPWKEHQCIRISRGALTVDSEVTQCCACRPLHLHVVALEQEHDWLQCVSPDFSDLLFCDFCEC